MRIKYLASVSFFVGVVSVFVYLQFMGVAAQHRGDVSIARGLRRDGLERDDREMFRRAVRAELEADGWRREAWAWFVDKSADGRGFCGSQVREMAAEGGRVFVTRRRKVLEAHHAWLDVHAHDQFGRTQASLDWARAVHSLLSHVTWGWKCEVLNRAPRSCQS